jgi:hypothetical protein
MVSKILNMLNKLRPSKTSPKRFTFMDVGFHGDLYLLELVDTIMNKCKYFVETGTNVGSTLTYVAKKYPEIQCFSCETDMAAFEHARQNTLGCGNVQLFNKASLDFLEQLFTRQEIGERWLTGLQRREVYRQNRRTGGAGTPFPSGSRALELSRGFTGSADAADLATAESAGSVTSMLGHEAASGALPGSGRVGYFDRQFGRAGCEGRQQCAVSVGQGLRDWRLRWSCGCAHLVFVL